MTTEQRDEIVRRMWLEENASAASIAMALSLEGIKASRNSVLGLIHRRGWKRQGISRAKVKRVPRHRKTKINPFNPPWGAPTPAIESVAVDAIKADVPTSDYAGPMNELGMFQCRWVDPDVEPAYDMTCCGRPFDEDSGVWLCDLHKAIALVKGKTRREIRPDRRDP